MLVSRALLLAAFLVLPANAEVRSGKATVEWIGASTTCEPGVAVQTAILLTVDPGWHTYWLNPGEGGMKPGVEWDLPAGWSASELAFPVPERFKAGGLAGFGYHGEVVFPVALTPPRNFSGAATLKVRISWLTCDDNACVPGEAELSLDLTADRPAPTAEAETIRDALKKIPRPDAEALRLTVTENPDTIVLTIDARAGGPLDLSRYHVFPATPHVIDPAADIRFARKGTGWHASVPKSAFAGSPMKQLTLVLASKEAEKPIELRWPSP